MPLHAPSDPGSAAVTATPRRFEGWACVILGAIAGWFFIWTALQPGESWAIGSRQPNGYYPLETAGFRSGHLYAAITPHPALIALKNPYDPVANAPYRVHDMSLYRGHYYLYFGVTPVLLLFWPVAAATGWYLSEPFAVGVFCAAAVWVGMVLLLAIRRRHFPAAPFVALFAAWLCLAWATPLDLLVEQPQFYEVPISCAIFLQALMLAAVYRSLHSPSRTLPWMAVAGLLFGLCVGARPNYLAGFLVLLVPIFCRTRSGGQPREADHCTVARALAWTFLPVAACGLGLSLYNWARFGSAFEFGMHYQLAGEEVTQLKAVSLRFLLPHAVYYLFTPGFWGSYFPFFFASAGQPYGLIRYLPWSWLMLGAFLRPKASEPGDPAGGIAIAAALGTAFMANLLLLSCFFGTTARYPGDFGNAALLLAGVGALALGQKAAVTGRLRLAQPALVVAATVAMLFSLAVYAAWFPRKEVFLSLARALNWPAFALQRANGIPFGGLHLELRLPEPPPDLAEPIFETGLRSDQSDWLAIEYLQKNRARLNFYHAGTGAFPSSIFSIPNDRRIVVEARCGSLVPPYGHPAYSDWTRDEYDAVKRDLRVTVNGGEVLRANLECYDSSPSNMTLGRLAWFSGGMNQAFSGSIRGVTRLPLEKAPRIDRRLTRHEPVEMTLLLPAAIESGADPLLVTGSGKESDLLYCVYSDGHRVSFADDHFGFGGPRSKPVTYDPLVPHAVTIWMGSMAGSALSEAAAPDRLVVLFDGTALLNVDQTFYPGSPDTAIFGSNAYGSTLAGLGFNGTLVGVRQLGSNVLPAVVRNGSYGSVEMTVTFPLGLQGTQEPLVVTGIPGAGDFLYVRYTDAGHVMFGFDHWGIGGFEGKPVEVDYARTHRVSVTFQALYPPGSAAHASDRVGVVLDGTPALVGNYACYPTPGDRIQIGMNPIGGSTCGPAFNGRVLGVQRFAEPRE